MKKKVLYLSYNGLNEPLGKSQILPYIKIINEDYRLHIISFENTFNDPGIYSLTEELLNLNINWTKFKRYKNNFFFNTFSLLKAFIYIFYLTLTNKVNIIHARSFIPATLALPIKFFFNNLKIIYDIRGFWVDEKVDRMNFNKGFFYKILKKIDKHNYLYADHIIFLTRNSFDIINKNFFQLKLLNYSIIPTCADKKIFYPIKNNNKLNMLNICYMGSISKAYNFKKILKYFSKIVAINTSFRLIIINKEDHNEILKYLNFYKIPQKNFDLVSLDRSQINKKLSEIDLGIFYANNNYSIKASYPTRIGEFLMAGKSIICNDFNSDISQLSKNEFIYITNFDIIDVNLEINKINKLISKNNFSNIRDYALQNFSNDIAKIKLKNIYRDLSK